MNKSYIILSLCFFLVPFAYGQKKVKILQVPGVDKYCQINPNAASVLPSGRVVTPVGKTIRITKGAFGLAISPDNKKAIALHNGVVTLIPLHQPDSSIRIPSYDNKIPTLLKNSSFIGVAFSKDSRLAYMSGGDNGSVIVFDTEKLIKIDEISLDGILDGKKYEDSYTSDLTIHHDKNELLVLDRGNNRLVRIDIPTKKLTASIPVGRIPFGIALNAEKNLAFVANVGLFDYPLVPGATPQNKDSMNLRFPAFPSYSKEMEDGITLPDGRKIPGLGSALADEAMSVWTINLTNNTVTSKLKTGRQIGEVLEDAEIVGGASPNSIAVGSKEAYVSNATNDLISVIDLKTQKIKKEIPLKFDRRLDKLRGIMPFGMCLSKDEKMLYVACLGLNAVAVIDAKKGKVIGYIPTGWGTSRVQLFDNDNKMAILSIRGYGAGPNGGKDFIAPPQGTYIGDIQLSTLQIVETPSPSILKAWTEQVKKNTFEEIEIIDQQNEPLPISINKHKSPIKHVVYITKENRTFDEVFGKLPNVKGDPSLARLSDNVMAFNKTDTIKNVSIAPNHINIAQQFAHSDNFYCDSDASIHGHHWMMGTIPNEYVEANSSTSARLLPFSSAKGRRFPKTTGGIDAEDYNEIGGLWENLERHGIDYFNFGECNEFANASEEKYDTIFGATNNVVYAFPKAIYEKTSRNYAGYNTNIPDQYRAYQFEKEFTEKWLSGKDTMPQFIGIQLPNDHGADIRPEDGYPYYHSYMADNDLALGRMLHFLSRTKYWKNMLIIVTEDDPQGGVDHIDAHRSILMMISPYAKRKYVSHTHANFGSILKTIYHILNLPYVNQYDATATLLTDFFQKSPNFTPYTVVNSDVKVFDPQVSLNYYNKIFDWRKIQQGPKMDDEKEQRSDFYKKN